MILLKFVYWAGLVIEIVVRYPFQQTRRTQVKSEDHNSRTERVLLVLLTLTLIPPLIYTLTPWLDFANYSLPPWLGWLGVVVYAFGLYLFARAHADLKSNWSPMLQIFEGHRLVTNGIYGTIRHPMYASQGVMAVAQALLLQNWLAGPIALVFFVPFYVLRVQAEEKMMLETFGEEYRQYMQKTGNVIPRL